MANVLKYLEASYRLAENTSTQEYTGLKSLYERYRTVATASAVYVYSETARLYLTSIAEESTEK